MCAWIVWGRIKSKWGSSTEGGETVDGPQIQVGGGAFRRLEWLDLLLLQC